MKTNWLELLSGHKMDDFKDMMLYIANIRRYDPSLSLKDALHFYRKSEASALDQRKIDLQQTYRNSVTPMATWGNLAIRPAVILSFHYGQYRTLPVRIMAAGFPICMLIADALFDKHREEYDFLMDSQEAGHVVFLRAEDPQVYFKLKKYRDKGYWIWAFLDGAKGMVGSEDLKVSKFKTIRLGQASLRIRKGIADMAYLLQMPVCMILDGIKDRLYFQPTLYRDRCSFSNDVLEQCYRQLAIAVEQDPVKWECWYYLHEDLLEKREIEGKAIYPRYLPVVNDKQPALLDTYSYQLLRINKEQMDDFLKSSVV